MTHLDNHRHCLLIRGNTHEILSQFMHVTQHLSRPLICSQDPSLYQTLNQDDFETCSFKQVRQQLGRTHQAVLLDLTQGVSASALAILAGTVRGGGLFALALPKDDWQSHVDKDLGRYLPWPYEPQQVQSYFKDYLLSRLENAQALFTSNLSPLPALDALPEHISLTPAQHTAQRTLLQGTAKHYVLCAPRGRGKSTLLGDSLAILCRSHGKVALVAVNQDAIGTLRKQFLTRCQQNGKEIELPFYAPDAFLADASDWDLLVVDEAAMLPVPQLIELSKRAKTTLFSTTDYGYEGAGRGFGLRFYRYLQQQHAAQAQVMQLELEEPIRWGKNDPLEAWVSDSFFFSQSWPEITQQKIPSSALDYQSNQAKDWLNTPNQLAQAFQLLAKAHYQTTADNLRWVLDDPSLQLHSLYESNQLRALAIVSEEGQLNEQLSQQIMAGNRRPRGHLLPQSLLAHEAIADAGQFQYWRISRIATQPSLHNQGIGSQLLQHIGQKAKQACDFLATSFAVTSEVLSFWLKNDYQIVRLGTAKDQASGCYSIMMLKAVSHDAKRVCPSWRRRFLDKFCPSLLLQYQDISCELILRILASHRDLTHLPMSLQLTSSEMSEIRLFIHHHKPLESLRPALYKACLQLAIQGHLQSHQSLHQAFLATGLGRPTQVLQAQARLSGKKDLLKRLKLLLKEHEANLIKMGG
ncbi:GNAT family N-acetyltransferase [Marinomonas sp. THO17]|uniref:GNAT family N-acetyltransferase n=1 Tax=Marinomonas sp. THO17 TaxID=3149048 RepID=UPI00336BDB48